MREVGGMATRYRLRSRRTSDFTELEPIADISMQRRRTRAAPDRRPLPSGARIGVHVTNASGQTIGVTVLEVP
jgi:hypothetical protein